MNTSRRNRRSPVAAGMYWATRISMIGFELALLPLAGYWLDRQWGTSPWLVIAGACLGMLAASFDFYALTKTRFGSSRKDDERKR